MKKSLMLLTNAFISDPRVENEAKALVEEGYKVTIFAWDREKKGTKEELRKGIEIKRCHIPSKHAIGSSQIFPLIKVWIKWFREAKEEDFDIVHCHDFDTLPIGWLIARTRKKKLIFDSHEIYSGMMQGHLPQIFVNLIKLLENFFIKRTDCVIVPTELYKKEYPLNKNKCTLVGNWKTINDYAISEDRKKQIKKELDIPEDEITVSYIANFGKGRIIRPLMEAVVKLRGKVSLIIAGRGTQEPIIKSYQEKNIKYLGFISEQKRIAELTAISDIIYYGINLESFAGKHNNPNKLYEAIAAGKVYVSVEEGESGYFLREYKIGKIMKEQTAEEIEKILLELYNNPQERKEMGERGLKIAKEKYNWKNAKDNLLKAYKELE